MYFTRCFKNEEYFVFCAFYEVLLERGILCFLCTSHGDFRTRNTHVVCANNEVLLKRGTLFLIVHLCGAFRTRNTTFFLRTSRVAFQHNKDYCCCLCTLRGDFRMRNTLVI